jgi:hypothetical protein
LLMLEGYRAAILLDFIGNIGMANAGRFGEPTMEP